MLIPKQSTGNSRFDEGVGARTVSVTRASISPAARVGGLSSSVSRGSALGFTCAPWGCVCTGDDDCNDMFSTRVCGPWAICIDNVCYCSR